MINKRLLVKNLLAHNDENSFYDKKRSIDIGAKEGKAKFLKHVCALANSNPTNNSFIVIGVEDDDNTIVGVDFFDDSKIQNLVNAYLENPPLITYENIPFPQLPVEKVVGLVTIRSLGKVCALRKNIWKYFGGMVFIREGSISLPKAFGVTLTTTNANIVASLEQNARNNIELTLDGVMDFMTSRNKHLTTHYKVFKEQFVVCWAGMVKTVKGTQYYSRVDIELINEQVRLFYSALDEISIAYTADQFSMIEYVLLGLGTSQRYYPLEHVSIRFFDNGKYTIESKLVFDPPQYDKKVLHHILNANAALLQKLNANIPLTAAEEEDMQHMPATLLLCFINDFTEAKSMMESSRKMIKEYNPIIYDGLKASLRILRKLKYH